jgi:RP/EB family microtubule-associated protein
MCTLIIHFNEISVQTIQHIEVARLTKARPLDNLEFMQWLKSYFDGITNNQPITDYDGGIKRQRVRGGSSGNSDARPLRSLCFVCCDHQWPPPSPLPGPGMRAQSKTGEIKATGTSSAPARPSVRAVPSAAAGVSPAGPRR